MTLGNYSSFLFNAIGGIGENVGRRAYQAQEDKSAIAFADDYEKRRMALSNLGQGTQQQQQNLSNLGQNGQPMPLIPAGYLDNAKQSESGGNLYAKNPNSSATGPHQFTDGTWADLAKNNPDLGLTPDGRTDPVQSEKAMARFTQKNAQKLYSQGVAVNPGTLYAAHFLGSGGALKVLSSDDNAQLNSILPPEVIKANTFLNGMSVAQFKDFANKKGGNPKGGYQVASNDPNFMPQMPNQGLQAPPTITNQVPNGGQPNQDFNARFGDAPQQPPSLQAQQPAPQQMAQATPQQASQGLPQQFTPQNNQSMLPDRETMLQLFKSEATRPYALAIAQAAQKGQEPGFKMWKDEDGNTLVQDLSTGEPKVLLKASESGDKADQYGFPKSGAISQKLRGLMMQGVPEQMALGLATGRYEVSLNPQTGERVIIDTATNKLVPLSQPDYPEDNATQTDPQVNTPQQNTSQSLYDMIPDATGVASTTGNALSNTVGQIPGAVGRVATFPKQVKAQQEFKLFKRDLIRSLTLNERYPVSEQNRIAELLPDGALTAPETLKTSAEALDRELSRIEQELIRYSKDPRTPVKQRNDDFETLRGVRAARARLGIPQGNNPAKNNLKQKYGLE